MAKKFLPSNNIYTSNRPSKENDASVSEGVMICVTKRLTSSQIEVCDDLKDFCCFCTFDLGTSSLTVECVYVPASDSPYNISLQKFNSMLNFIPKLTYDHLSFTADFNFHGIDWTTYSSKLNQDLLYSNL